MFESIAGEEAQMEIHKFGGATLNGSGKIANVVEIIRHSISSQIPVIVSSAIGNTTDRLYRIVDAADSVEAASRLGSDVLQYHRRIADELGIGGTLLRFLEAETEFVADMREVMHTGNQVRSDLRLVERFVANGEKLAVGLIADVLRVNHGIESRTVHAEHLIRTETTAAGNSVDYRTTQELIDSWSVRYGGKCPVLVPGFTGSNALGETTLLGRNGSDLTATVLGAALNAEAIHIWTDVDGIFTADPNILEDAISLPWISREEAATIAFMGAEVLHPDTMQPLSAKNIPVRVRCAASPERPGTLIGGSSSAGQGAPNIALRIRDVAIVSIFDPNRRDPNDLAIEYIILLKSLGIQYYFISNGISGRVIRVAIHRNSVKVFQAAMNVKWLSHAQGCESPTVQVREDVHALALTGDGIHADTRLIHEVSERLERHGIHVIHSGTGGIDHCISVLVDSADSRSALELLHSCFVLGRLKIPLILAGATGNVGSQVLREIAEKRASIFCRHGIYLEIAGALNSKAMALSGKGILPESVSGELSDGAPFSESALLAFASEFPSGCIFVDCTASEELPGIYPRFLNEGHRVVTANKHAVAAEWNAFVPLSRYASVGAFRYETTAGAATPFIRIIRERVLSGDELFALEAVLSGSVSFMLERMNQGLSFSQSVLEASRRGYAEPDPSADLSGMDAARKLLILLRESGWERHLDGITVEPLDRGLAVRCAEGEYLQELELLDGYWKERIGQAQKNGSVLAYVARARRGETPAVRIEEVPPSSPLAPVGTRNVLSIFSKQFCSIPLTVTGPGAGVQFTANGVLSDILDVAIVGKSVHSAGFSTAISPSIDVSGSRTEDPLSFLHVNQQSAIEIERSAYVP